MSIAKNILLLVLGWLPFTGNAQKNGKYTFSEPVKRWVSVAEADSVMAASVRQLFGNNGNSNLFDTAYPAFKKQLEALVFYRFNARAQGMLPPAKRSPAAGTAAYDSIKQQLFSAITAITEQQFNSSYIFKKYQGLNVSDRINRFHAKVTVRPNGTLLVEETIRIYNGNGAGIRTFADNMKEEGGGNNEIQRGIFRTFPTVYADKYKLLHPTTFKVLKVTRSDIGREEWKLKRYRNGYLLYLGNANKFLSNGYYTYTITYETSKQIKFLKDFDELYWNVTGNAWSFRIDSASCTIVLPDSARVISGACYTGIMGDTASNCLLKYTTSGNTIYTATTRALKPNQGLTLAVSWPKAIVHNNETRTQYAYRMLKHNQAVLLLPLLALLFGLYNYFMWWRVGRDPRPGTIIPEYYPPKGLSPAAMGYIHNQGFDNRLVAATITDWAVKKYITIDVTRKGFLFKKNVYKIKDGPAKAQYPGYHDYASDSEDLENTTIQRGTYNKSLGDFCKSLKTDLEGRYKATRKNFFKGFFVLNNWYMAPGNLLTTLGFFYILFGVFTRPGMWNPWHILYFAGGIVLCIWVQVVFYKLIKAYTPEGRKVMDQVEGFKMFLTAADEQRINFVNPPEKNLQLYETYLPFAIALDCEIEWGKQFEDIIRSASIDPDSGSISSSSFGRDVHSSSFSSSFAGSLSGAISSASTPPSSSSGGGSSFGGGFSGGGGGGGGGGGW
ncbi:MAG: DUF2207 domain-containing protein [Dinghuibacter sp.]|nr:DUF2207 domain-containing protein [Dinghuibacter sp.]